MFGKSIKKCTKLSDHDMLYSAPPSMFVIQTSLFSPKFLSFFAVKFIIILLFFQKNYGLIKIQPNHH